MCRAFIPGGSRLSAIGLLCLLLLAAPCPVGPAQAAPQSLQAPSVPVDIEMTNVERAAVLKGRVIIRDVPCPGKKGRTVEALGLLDGTLDQAFAVITDYRRYPEFMPRVANVAVTEIPPSAAVVDCTLDVPLVSDKRYRLRYTATRTDAGFNVVWEKLPWPELKEAETVADTNGYWLVRRLDGAGLCAVYHVYTDPGPVPLGLTGTAHALSRSGVRDVILKTRQRIRNVFLGRDRSADAAQTSAP